MDFGVTPEKVKALRKKMQALDILEEDIHEKFICSQGHGGQKVNRTATCVYLKHIPTGIAVKCQKSRSQPLNRFLARRYLVEKIEEKMLGKENLLERKRQRIRKQKMKRKKRTRIKTHISQNC